MLSFLFALAEGMVEVATVVAAATVIHSATETTENALKDKRS